MLTKTAYLSFTHCPKHLWLAEYRRELATAPDLTAQRRLQTGIEVDRLARD